MRPILLLLPLLAATAPAPAPAPAREPELADLLTLDRDQPVVPVEIAGRRLRLAVDLSGKGTVDLNPAAAAGLGNLRFGGAPDAVLGAETLKGRQARAVARIGGMAVPLVVTDYDRPVADGVDGTIAAALLPYRTVRLARPGAAPVAATRLTFPLVDDDANGSHVRMATPSGPLFILFGLDRAETVATRSAGTRLAALGGGRIEGPVTPMPGAFGLPRDTRRLTFARPVALAGRVVRSVAVRIDDYRGRQGFPAAPGPPGALVVQARPKPGETWPAILLGRDRLGDCPEIVLTRAPATITLACTAP
ncbi:MAG: hypothetical protein PGN09_11850 [Sphingomonas fennica]